MTTGRRRSGPTRRRAICRRCARTGDHGRPERLTRRGAGGASVRRGTTSADYAARMAADGDAITDLDAFLPPLRVRGVRGAPIESLGDWLCLAPPAGRAK